MSFRQTEFDICCEWGPHGVTQLATSSDVVIIVDVLSFSTCTEIAVSRGAQVHPYRHTDEVAVRYAASVGASLASTERDKSFSLSPASLLEIPRGTRLVLPSPNGATLGLMAGATETLTACLRNAAAAAKAAAKLGRRIAVIPAGEQWPDKNLRPALEDWLGAGAIIHHLQGTRSPEAAAAAAAYAATQDDIARHIHDCGSARELVEAGFERDVELAAELNVSTVVPHLVDSTYIAFNTGNNS
ncbi:MAG: 2-phosphosulfolactate phosphatase [Phycisphaerae bacterium]|nr:2-phosphosulfolactate phosphatase [Phycisphaerae bacterium]